MRTISIFLNLSLFGIFIYAYVLESHFPSRLDQWIIFTLLLLTPTVNLFTLLTNQNKMNSVIDFIFSFFERKALEEKVKIDKLKKDLN